MRRFIHLCVFISLISFNICAQVSGDSKKDELMRLISSANFEMTGGFDNKQSDGSYKETNKAHLEVYGKSCAYVFVFIKSYIDSANAMKDYKNKQLEVYRYVELNPEFKKLIDFLIAEDLPLYQYYISNDGKYKTSVTIYDKSDLEQFGTYATK